MPKSTQPVPAGLTAVTPQLVCKGADSLLGFLGKAFGGEQPFPAMRNPDGTVMHGHVRIGAAVVFVSEAGGFAKPTSANVFLYVPDVDKTFAAAVAAGAKPAMPPTDMFWGDRWSMVEDPFGNVWQVATHVEDVAPEELQRRMASLPKAK